MKISKKVIFATASFVILILQAFGVKVDVPLVNEIVAAGAGILVMLGIVSDTHTSASSGNEGEQMSEDQSAASGENNANGANANEETDEEAQAANLNTTFEQEKTNASDDGDEPTE